ncbi:MAG TPA: PilT/PilU family type 4a pilus ATPase [Patescibacteria group bacterium]
MHTKIEEVLNLAVNNNASDIHFFVGILPKIRINGNLVDVTGFENLNPEQTSEMLLSILTEDQKKIFLAEKELDFSLAFENARFRCNIYFEKSQIACALRVVPKDIPTFDALNLPKIINQLTELNQGFILVTGPTGHGKSTTVASSLNEINHKRGCHIVTIEDPIEYLIKPDKCIISQRELGGDTLTFPNALRSVLRQDPNVVYVGEMRDLETISSALTIAETGHLVFSTLHTNSAAQTIDRIVDVFPEGAKEQIRVQLASVITAVVSQRLIPTLDGRRTPAFEIMVATPALKNIVREGKTFMIDNIIQTSADLGMVSLETSLAKLVKTGIISEDVAMSYCLRPSELQNQLRNTKMI